MKKIFLGIIATVCSCVLVCSCNGSSSSKRSEADMLNDSLMLVTLQQQNEIAELVGTLTDISGKLDQINGSISLENGEENSDLVSQRDKLMSKLQDVQARIEEKQTQLDKLQSKYSAMLSKNKELKKTIDRMQSEIDGYVAKIKDYETQLYTKNQEIAQLSTDLSSTKDSLSEVASQNEGHKTTLAAQDKMLNNGFYVIETKKKLKEMGLVKDGLFTAAKISPKTFDTTVFKQIDIREVTEIPLGSKDAKVLSAMPEGSYEIVKDYDRTLKIVIKDPATFWSITRYLVVMI